MILAAGFGTRLLPFTRLRPKPLFPLLNTPLLLLTVKRLQNAGFDHIIVNCHYLREQIVDALAGIPGVVVQQEDMVLGTGGGLRLALSLMHDEPILITNGDIYHTVDYARLYTAHMENAGNVSMAMHDYPRFNKVTVQGERVVSFDNEHSGTALAFTGLHVLEPSVLQAIPLEKEYSIIDRYREILQAGDVICSLRVDNCSWTDMGTVEDYLQLHGKLLRQEIPLWDEFAVQPKTSFWVDPGTDPAELSLHDWACVGRIKTESKKTLRRCVVWDNADLGGSDGYDDMLLT